MSGGSGKAGGKALMDILGEYLDHMRALNFSRLTVRIEYYNCLSFLKWLEDVHGISAADRIAGEHILEWQRHSMSRLTRKGLPLKPRSVNRRTESLKSLLDYLAGRGMIHGRLAGCLEYVKEPKLLPVGILAHAEMRRMLDGIDTATPCGYRDRAIMELMYSCGLRAGEVVRMDLGSMDFGSALAKIHGKGSKERMVPVGATALRFAETWLRAVRPLMKPAKSEKAMFLNANGARIQYHTIRLIVLGHSRKAELSEKITTHSFRRSCATELIRGGANIYHVKELLGHEDLQTLKHYTRLTITDLRKTHAECHPREKEKDE